MKLARSPVNQPQVARRRTQNLTNLLSYDRQQVQKLQCGVERAADVVERGEPVDRSQAGLALLLESLEGSQGSGRKGGGPVQEDGVVGCKLAAPLVEHLHHAGRPI